MRVNKLKYFATVFGIFVSLNLVSSQAALAQDKAAEPAPSYYVNIFGVSRHSSGDHNEFNAGLGLEKAIGKDWTLGAGYYRNSNWKGSAYAMARYSFYRAGRLELAVQGGLITGYTHLPVIPIAIPVVCYSVVCATAIPRLSSNAALVAANLRIPF